ncbi:MAG: MBL fold metallo-hydrolase [Spirochaetaceae bacterium]
MKIIHYRHATSIIELNNKRILIDPVFAGKETYPPIVYSYNNRRNPLVDLPINYEELFNVDGVLITHNHNDHFDELAKKVLPKNIPILCQVEDNEIFEDLGFTNLTSITDNRSWLGFDCTRFIGSHGGKLLKNKLGISSAYLLESSEGILYLTGDTLLTPKIKNTLLRTKPNWIIANGGAAKMKFLGQITMGNRDIIKISKLLPDSTTVAVHMDSINHCGDTRDKLRDISYNQNVFIPGNGDILNL